MAKLTVRVEFGEAAIGPGKARLLEMIAAHGSIAAGGRAMDMSYRRAWLLVDELNRMFRTPLVSAQLGGARGGGAVLTALGHQVLARYRAIERRAATAAAADVKVLRRALASR